MAEKEETIVMFPYMAQGHIIPVLALALEIEQRKGYNIIFVNTPLNIKRIRSSLPPNTSIRLLEIPFRSSDHGLPPDCENTNDLPYHLLLKLFEASSSLKPSFRKLICDLISEQQGHLPLCFISDMLFGWCADIAHEFGVFHAIFSPCPMFSIACYYSLGTNACHSDHHNKESKEFMFSDFPQASGINITQMSESLKISNRSESFSMYLKKLLRECANADGTLVNTVEELDKAGLMYFRHKFGRPIWPIGPVLLTTGCGSRIGNEAANMPDICINWLDTKPHNSVLYVSFGSQNTLPTSQMMQLAMALEASGKNFVWVVRPPIGFNINLAFKAKEWLPEGFEDRIRDSGRGLLVHQWAPQVQILSHKSTSAFLSHCGWNSALEALSHGVPIIGWPMGSEQFYNVKLLEEEIGVCVEVARGKSCEVRHEDIMEKIETVMNETDKGKEMRRKAFEVGEIIKNAIKDEGGFKGVSVRAMDEFLNAAMGNRERTKKTTNDSI